MNEPESAVPGRNPTIVVVGSVNLDLTAKVPRLPEPGETVSGAELGRFPGGKGANQALAARRLGADVMLHARVGDDANAEEALAIGLVNRVMAQEELAAEAEAMAKTMAAKGPIALRYAKEAVSKGLDLTLEQGLRLESDLYLLLHTTKDRTEGIRAFLEKRSPQFKGQ